MQNKSGIDAKWQQKADGKEEMMIASNKCEISYCFMLPQQIIENWFFFRLKSVKTFLLTIGFFVELLSKEEDKKKFNLFFILSITACYPMFMFFCRVFHSHYHVNIFFITWYKASILKIFSFFYDSFFCCSSPSCWLLPSFCGMAQEQDCKFIRFTWRRGKNMMRNVFFSYIFMREKRFWTLFTSVFCMFRGKLQLIGTYEIFETFFFVR